MNPLPAAQANPNSCADPGAMIASLRRAGAERFDPVRLHYIEALARRRMIHQGQVRCILDDKLAHALNAFEIRFERAQRDAQAAVAVTVPCHPNAADALQRFCDAGDFHGLRRFAATLRANGQLASEQGTSLGALVRQLERHASGNASAEGEGNASARWELNTLRRFRNTWSKLSADKQVTQALAQPTENAGPLNSHMLVLRSLELMRDISPDYLNRFMTYAHTLLCLDQCEQEKVNKAKKPAATKRKK